MGLNQTPAAERIHIGFFGRRNAGKSSVLNAVTGQEMAVVSHVKGTTTDPVYKSMELLPLGPVVMMDTPGMDDEGELGSLRVKKSRQVLNRTDMAVLVIDGTIGMGEEEREILKEIEGKKIPFIAVLNKMDLDPAPCCKTDGPLGKLEESGLLIRISARDGTGIKELKEKLGELAKEEGNQKTLTDGLIGPGDLAVLVVPIDKAAPKGRLILPQQQTIRDILDHGGSALVVPDDGLKQALGEIGKKPKIVITDSQIFDKAAAATRDDILLTSFSILFARYKGNLAQAVQGVRALERIEDGDKILISEGCTHHRQCGDIGTVKLPAWIRRNTGKEPVFRFTSGQEFPEDLKEYKLIVHCGGCMLNEREMRYRLGCARDQGIPMTNYGILIAHLKGILERAIKIP
ncbi:MAG: [FeFe] hydrogenase H-cluster maturation GTPase HydF [Lachnospiraceae bacterium]|nr:[FeFe] hydrogenase H-cluster maturation GTPase HydF [Lachnospiraceae bacterium]